MKNSGSRKKSFVYNDIKGALGPYPGFKDASPVLAPEKLYKDRNFIFISLLCLILFIVLMLCRIEGLYLLFNIHQNKIMPLWHW